MLLQRVLCDGRCKGAFTSAGMHWTFPCRPGRLLAHAMLYLGPRLPSKFVPPRDRLFPTHFKNLYPGHPNLDSYIFGGGGATPSSAALQQVRTSPRGQHTDSHMQTCASLAHHECMQARGSPPQLSSHAIAVLNQVGSTSRPVMPTASLKQARNSMAAGLKAPGGLMF